MPKQEFPFPMPNGWFCIVRSHELENGDLKSIKFCEKDVAAFRTESGKVGVLDAYCGYSGINLGISGRIEGENLVCPKHGIKWDINGTCADIDEKSNVPESASEIQMFHYPVVEVNGFIWAWHHLHQKEPEWEVPAIEGFNGDDEKWGKTYYYDYNINTVLQEIAENDVDQAHFPKVHGSPSLPETEAITEGIYKKTIAETLMDPNNDLSLIHI